MTLQVATKALETGMFGAYFNVLINLKDISDDKFKDQVSSRRSGKCGQPPAGGGLAGGQLSSSLGWHFLFITSGRTWASPVGGPESCRDWGPCTLDGAVAQPP